MAKGPLSNNVVVWAKRYLMFNIVDEFRRADSSNVMRLHEPVFTLKSLRASPAANCADSRTRVHPPESCSVRVNNPPVVLDAFCLGSGHRDIVVLL